MGVLYSDRSNDAIFPTSNETATEANGRTWYRRPTELDSVLSCVDTNRFRIPAVSRTWEHLRAYENNSRLIDENWFQKADHQTQVGAALLLKAMMFSYVGDGVKGRGGQGLLASKMLRQGYSDRIADDHWIKEAKLLFETSLARIAIDLRDIALGTGAKYGGRKQQESGFECDRAFLFKTQGWQNIHVVGSAWILILSTMIILLAVPVTDDELVAERVWLKICDLGHFVKARLITYYSKTFYWAKRVWREPRRLWPFRIFRKKRSEMIEMSTMED